MQRAFVDGKVLEFEVAGSGDPVAFIHGSFVADAFRPMVEQPSLPGYRLITYHRRGYLGSSPADRPLSVAEQVADCRGLLGHLGIQRCHVVGHSFGGAVAVQLALDFPGLVHTLALFEPALTIGETGQSYRQSLEQGIQRFRELDASAVVDGFLQARWPGYREPLEMAVPGAFAQSVADAETAFEAELPGLLDWSFEEAQAARITQPVLSVVGGGSLSLWDRFGEVHRLLLAWMPHAEGFILPGANHFLQLENPNETAAALAAFYSRNPLSRENSQSG